MTVAEVLANATNRGGFTPEEVAVLAADPHTCRMPLLVRCDGWRFQAAAQDVLKLVALVESGFDHADDYVRDVSLPADDCTGGG